MALRRWLLLVCLALPACGLPVLQPPTVASRLALVPTQAVDAPPEEARRFAVRPEGSILEVFVNDLATGPHTLVFTRFRGSLVPEGPGGVGSLTLTVDLRSVRTDTEMVAAIVRDELLQVYEYPHARITASLRPGSGPNERRIEGNVLLHGVTRGLKLTGTLRRHGERWTLVGEFEMSRKAHGIRRNPDLDWMITDEFLVKLDLLATPEQVMVEMGPAPVREP
jgi:polyisoprenoid-binding protein YceI